MSLEYDKFWHREEGDVKKTWNLHVDFMQKWITHYNKAGSNSYRTQNRHKNVYFPPIPDGTNVGLLMGDSRDPGGVAMSRGGLVPAPTRSSSEKSRAQSLELWMLAALVRKSSCKAYEICLDTWYRAEGRKYSNTFRDWRT